LRRRNPICPSGVALAAQPGVARASGFTFLELLCVMALVVIIAGAAVPQILTSLDRSRGLIAARYLGSRLALARTQAVTRNASVALRFERGPKGISIAVYQDGNRNGVRTADIERQIDRRIEAPMRLFEQFPGVDIALGPDMPAEDPVQLGRTDILSFSPSGTATSGTIYVRSRDGTQWSVRVLGVTGRTRVLRYERRIRDWVPAF
jgi:prepilin-type N-terminal cleavage/methylation domain-containing protein